MCVSHQLIDLDFFFGHKFNSMLFQYIMRFHCTAHNLAAIPIIKRSSARNSALRDNVLNQRRQRFHKLL